MTVRHVTKDHYASDYATVVEQRERDKLTTLQFRRIIRRDEGEQLQIEISIDTFHKTKTTSAYASFVCPPEIADLIAEACAKIRERAPKAA